MGSAFIFCNDLTLARRGFKGLTHAHICIQVTSLHASEEFKSNSKFPNRKLTSRNAKNHQSYNLI